MVSKYQKEWPLSKELEVSFEFCQVWPKMEKKKKGMSECINNEFTFLYFLNFYFINFVLSILWTAIHISIVLLLD